MTITVDDAVAPATGISVFMYNGSGQGGVITYGGVSAPLSGTVTFGASIPAGMPPGTYTLGFELSDAAGLHTFYGTPGAQPVPGGPLVLTITPS